MPANDIQFEALLDTLTRSTVHTCDAIDNALACVAASKARMAALEAEISPEDVDISEEIAAKPSAH